MARTTPNPQLDDFVARVVKDPANPPNAVVVRGYLGASDADDHVRVYGDPSLQSYVDIPRASVLHSERLPVEQSPLGGSVLWVDGTAPLRPPAEAARAATAADFLRGPIQATLGPATHALDCPTSICPPTNAPSLGIACTVVDCPRPTAQLGCPRTSTCPPTHTPGCPDTSTCGHGHPIAFSGGTCVPTQWMCPTNVAGCAALMPNSGGACVPTQWMCPTNVAGCAAQVAFTWTSQLSLC